MNIWTAAADNNIEKVRHFISSANQTPNSKDENGYTPMHAAAEYGHIELLDYLIQRGGDINIVDNDGDTPLHACETVKVAEYLIARGANPELQNSEGLTPLAKAEEDSEFLDLIRFYQIKTGIIPPKEEEDQTFDIITEEQREKLQQIIENGTDADFENYLRECISGNAEAHAESHKRVKTDE